MKIVSVSLTGQNVSDLGRIKKERGLSNASEAFRTALHDAIEKLDNEKQFEGNHTAALVLRHSHETESFVSNTKHRFQFLIKSQNHLCTAGDECIDFFLVNGNASQIKKMRDAFIKNKKIQKVAWFPL